MKSKGSNGQLTMLVPATAVAASTWCEIFSHHQERDRSSVHRGQLSSSLYMVSSSIYSIVILLKTFISMVLEIYQTTENGDNQSDRSLGMEEEQ